MMTIEMHFHEEEEEIVKDWLLKQAEASGVDYFELSKGTTVQEYFISCILRDAARDSAKLKKR